MIENFIIIYDIKGNSKKYNKIYKILNKYFSKPIQKSVFLVQEERKEIIKLSKKLKKIINVEKDKLLIIPLCEDDWQSVCMFGVEKKKGIEKNTFLIL